MTKRERSRGGILWETNLLHLTSIARIARHDEHRDLHVHADLSITEIRERADERLAVSGHVTRDGRGDVLSPVRVRLLIRLLAWQRK